MSVLYIVLIMYYTYLPELRPLTDGEVVTYGSNGHRGEVGEGGRRGVGREEEDFVVIVTDEDEEEGAGSKECSCRKEESHETVSPAPSGGGVGKTAQDRLVSSCTEREREREREREES